jgi:geranylgeranyl diphosphate synthase type II
MVEAAAAIELLHCASLVHDDLPCFDAAVLRRGRPSVHRAYGERIAVLTGDALIVLAYQTAARAVAESPQRLGAIIQALSRAAGAPAGICSGQAWECESQTPLSEYQQQKTGALFVAATTIGAIAAGVDPAPWQRFGECLGEAYQVADDIRDVLASTEELGKPAGRDAALGRPSCVAEVGVAGSVRRFEALFNAALDAIPPCAGARAVAHLDAARGAPVAARESRAPGSLRHRGAHMVSMSQAVTAPRSMLESFRGWRDRTISSAKFQSWAAAFPLTRPFARRHARAVFDLAAGFIYSQVLLACVQLDLLRILAEGPQGVAALANRTGLTPRCHAAPARSGRVVAAAAIAWPRSLRTRGRWAPRFLATPASSRWSGITRCCTKISAIRSLC